ncbi:hypothetical protein [Streptosporangium carneum]|uniref:Uncharacterized protein n=1 Tax=Streptosporangium carneum TaxID=47481 RepID=A0A9W6I2R1_9ACTN|nr:hypothetical protein [Streptosporangium carneum]GLK10341.1 hypothetical protein GCM10017600_37470 [Streptosporangium carneum]
MTETDPESTQGEPPAQVPDDREDSAGADAPAGIDPQGPEPQIPDDRKGVADSGDSGPESR